MRFSFDFFQFCEDREKLRMAPGTWPWSEDPVLNHWRFTNIFREDDPRTKWFRRNIREPLANNPNLLIQACVAFRWFDSIPAGEILAPYLRGERDWSEPQVSAELQRLPHVCHPMSAAARVSAQNRVPALLQAIRPFALKGPHLGLKAEEERWDLREMHEALCKSDSMPPRLAYEIVLDLRHTCVLSGAYDIDIWSLVTPEIAGAMGYVFSDDPEEFAFGHDRTRDAVPDHMLHLLQISRDFIDGPPWEMAEVYSALHNFYYYRSAQRGLPALIKYPL